MVRPKTTQPTPAELESLQVLWDRGPSTVREVMQALNARRKEQRAYTSVMSLLNVMAEKRLVTRTQRGRAFVYETQSPREQTQGRLISDLLGRAFDGSVSALVTQLLDQSNPSDEELAEIRRIVAEHEKSQENKS